MVAQKQLNDDAILELHEDISKNMWKIKEKYGDIFEKDTSQILRLKKIIEQLETERRLIEDISLPCRFILEHFSTFMGKPDYNLGFSVGHVEVGRGILNSFSIAEWGNVTLSLGNVNVTWRDEDYKYMFYPDKVFLRSSDLSKPEIKLFFNFQFKLSKLLPSFLELREHKKVLYWHPDLLE